MAVKVDQALLQDSPSVPLRKSLADITGSAGHALVLQQIIHWTPKARDSDGWVWKSAAELSDELCRIYKARKIGNILTALCNAEFLERKRDPNGMHRYLYRVNAGLINEQLQAWQESRTTCGDSCTPCGDSRTTRGSEHRPPQRSRDGEDIPSASHSSISSKEQPKPGEDQDGDTLFDRPLDAYRHAVDDAMAKNMAMLRAVVWDRLPAGDNWEVDASAQFGAAARIAWSGDEIECLKQIATFCHDQWPDLDPVEMAGQIVRAAFRPGGKAGQIVRYWIKHAGNRITLKPWVRIGAGKGKNGHASLLYEIAAIPIMQDVAATTQTQSG